MEGTIPDIIRGIGTFFLIYGVLTLVRQYLGALAQAVVMLVVGALAGGLVGLIWSAPLSALALWRSKGERA